MAYEVFLIPVAPGADAEEAGEALLARLAGAAETPGPWTGDGATAAVVAALRAADASVAAAPAGDPAAARDAAPVRGGSVPVAELRASHGIGITIARTFVRFRVPFRHRGEDAEEVFASLFRMLGAAAEATGWAAYDPQDAAAVPQDDAGREATLEIYLSVMDQIRPAAGVAGEGPRQVAG